MALERIVRARAKAGIPVVLVVLPLSPSYEERYLEAGDVRRFEARLAACRDLGAQLIRLDEISDLRSDAMFADLVHLNLRGREVATEAVMAELPELLQP